jgi:hypothetical protein
MGLFELAAAIVYLALALWHFRSREWFGGTCYFLLSAFAAGVFLTSGGLAEMNPAPQIASTAAHGAQLLGYLV